MSAPFNDRGPFRVGEVCVIVKTLSYPELMGKEVTIAGPARPCFNFATGDVMVAYDVDLVHLGLPVAVPEDCLRRRRPPTTGEDAIMALFKAPPVERRKPATAWQAQYDTAQALMAMGVRVRPGKWPVEVA